MLGRYTYSACLPALLITSKGKDFPGVHEARLQWMHAHTHLLQMNRQARLGRQASIQGIQVGRQSCRQAGSHTGRQSIRHTGKHIGTQEGIQTDRHTDRQADRRTGRQTGIQASR